MRVESFLDTNVLVVPVRSNGSEPAPARSGCISYQVAQETINGVTTKLNPTPPRARQPLDDLRLPLWRVHPTPTLYSRGLDVRDRYGFSYYDSRIVKDPELSPSRRIGAACAPESLCNRLRQRVNS